MNNLKNAAHVVLRARLPVLRLKKNKTLISQLLCETAERFQVKIYNNSLNSNHIHLLVTAKTQKHLHDFLRVLTGQIAQRITGAVRGRKNKLAFWLKPAWKRIVHWGRDFFNLHHPKAHRLKTARKWAANKRPRTPDKPSLTFLLEIPALPH
ncbi:MAG: hypothetical protein EB078_08210 [Proteobacteria bacterium]|nr:hypothetical protein [Pseudomonadota bacterium]NDD04874.1 hypothetical protein [Pseudomonadota bacterium]